MVVRTVCSCALASALLFPATSSWAQESDPPRPIEEATRVSIAQLAMNLPPVVQLPPSSARVHVQASRPRLLVPLYTSHIALQALDVYTTTRGLRGGAVEANPVMKDIARRPAALVAMKAATSAAVVLGTEKLWKKNRAAAVLVMIGVNAGMAYVVSNNYRVMRSGPGR
jgi:hypothetical protein